MDLFYNKNSLDDSDFDENKKMTLDCYIEQYINKDEGRKYVPIQVVFSGAKYDLENEKHKKLFDYKMKYIKVKNKNMVHIPWEIVLLRGAEEAEFDESMLTDSQREQVELGIKSVDDFRPKGNIYGDRIDEFRLFEPKLEGDYADGVLECDDTADEFEEKIFCSLPQMKRWRKLRRIPSPVLRLRRTRTRMTSLPLTKMMMLLRTKIYF